MGDDVAHIPLLFHPVPDYIGSVPPNVSSDTPIDLVFTHHIEPRVLEILNSIQTSKNFTEADVQPYSPIQANQALGLFAQKAWN